MSPTLLLSILFIPSPFFLLVSSQVPDCNERDLKALLNIKSELGNPSSIMTWGGARSCCGFSLEGISCNDQNRVVSVSVIDVPRPIRFPSSISQIQFLREISLPNNKLIGPIPTFLCNMLTIESIDVSRNSLTGSIPDCFGNSKIRSVDLSYNKLGGYIPKSLPMSVVLLDLSHNQLTGGIPSKIVELKGLKHFDVSYNKLCGKIPSGGVMSRFNQPSYFHNNHCLCGSVCMCC